MPSWLLGMNPFRRNQTGHANAEPCSIVIFGASGDLTRRKLIPAIFNLVAQKSLTVPFDIIAFARREETTDSFREKMLDNLRKYSRTKSDNYPGLTDFLSSLSYHRGNFENLDDFVALEARLKELETRRGGPHNRLYYMATPPDAFSEIIRNLKAAGMTDHDLQKEHWVRIVVEKPYGHDLKSAWMLTGAVHAGFSEDQIYRIDHYLGKETVQNILAFRLGNGIFEPLWNCRYIDHVQITVGETLGIEGRAAYFEKAGIIRDMLQSHIFQLLSLIAMEPPASFDAKYIRDEKVKLLRSIYIPDMNNLPNIIVRGQYTAGSVGGKEVPGYRQEEGVNPQSMTETYLAIKLEIENWRWAGVPFYIRMGKRMAKKVTEADIIFKTPPHQIFKQVGNDTPQPNVLGIKIQPDEGISLNIGCKRPGQSYQIDPVNMEFNYATSFGTPTPEAYERLILDAILGDSTLFAREDEVDLSWQLIDPIIETWGSDPGFPIAFYEAGSWGPRESSVLLSRSGRNWQRL